MLMSRELRIACTVAQMEREGGISPRVSPLAQVCMLMSSLLFFTFFSLDFLFLFPSLETLMQSNIYLVSFRSGMQAIFWPGQVSLFLVLMLMNMWLNIKVVRIFACFFSRETLAFFKKYIFSIWVISLPSVALHLIEHLRAMGETNALLQRNKVRHSFDGDNVTNE